MSLAGHGDTRCHGIASFQGVSGKKRNFPKININAVVCVFVARLSHNVLFKGNDFQQNMKACN